MTGHSGEPTWEAGRGRRKRPLAIWRPRLTDPEAARLLHLIAQATARLLVRERRLPGTDEVAAHIESSVRDSDPAAVERSIEQVLSSGVWTAPATDPQWRLAYPGPAVWTLRRVLVKDTAPAVLFVHPYDGFCYAQWIHETYGTGRWAWDYVHLLGARVARTHRLNLWRHRLIGRLYLTTTGSEVTRRILPDHVRSAEWIARSAVLFENGTTGGRIAHPPDRKSTRTAIPQDPCGRSVVRW